MTYPAFVGRHRQLHLKARLLEVEFENMAVADAVWHRSLDSLCKISHEDISRIACALTKTNKKAISKGYKLFSGTHMSTIWKVRVKICCHIIMFANLSVKCHYSKMCLHSQ